jgi:hypothetical protein
MILKTHLKKEVRIEEITKKSHNQGFLELFKEVMNEI